MYLDENNEQLAEMAGVNPATIIAIITGALMLLRKCSRNNDFRAQNMAWRFCHGNTPFFDRRVRRVIEECDPSCDCDDVLELLRQELIDMDEDTFTELYCAVIEENE